MNPSSQILLHLAPVLTGIGLSVLGKRLAENHQVDVKSLIRPGGDADLVKMGKGMSVLLHRIDPGGSMPWCSVYKVALNTISNEFLIG